MGLQIRQPHCFPCICLTRLDQSGVLPLLHFNHFASFLGVASGQIVCVGFLFCSSASLEAFLLRHSCVLSVFIAVHIFTQGDETDCGVRLSSTSCLILMFPVHPMWLRSPSSLNKLLGSSQEPCLNHRSFWRELRFLRLEISSVASTAPPASPSSSCSSSSPHARRLP